MPHEDWPLVDMESDWASAPNNCEILPREGASFWWVCISLRAIEAVRADGLFDTEIASTHPLSAKLFS